MLILIDRFFVKENLVDPTQPTQVQQSLQRWFINDDIVKNKYVSSLNYGMALTIACHQKIAQDLKEKLPFPTEITTFNSYTDQEIMEATKNSEVLVSYIATSTILEKAKKLKFIQAWSAGIDKIDLAQAERRDIKVCHLKGVNSECVANYVLAAIMLANNRLHTYDAQNRQYCKNFAIRAINRLLKITDFGFPRDGQFKKHDLSGKTLAIIGYGTIGQKIALRAKSFDMKVFAIKRTLGTRDNCVDFLGTTKDLQVVLKEADFVSIHLPLTKDTIRIIGSREIAAMKQTAYLINASRPQTVDNQALLSGLKKGVIAGAVLDVVEEDLAPSFYKLDNAIVTPHISGETEESIIRGVDEVAENIQRYYNHKILLNEVKAENGY